MAEISDLQILDANNTARFPDGMTVSAVNNAARALEGLIARWHRDTSYVLLTTGTGAAYQITPYRAVPALGSGLKIEFVAHVANTGAATMTVQGLAAKPLVRANGVALVLGDIVQHQPVCAVYVAGTDKFHCLGITA
jgi:hypothetical protein